MALVGVAGAAATDLLEPWPIKIVLDYVLQSKPMPGWMIGMVSWIGGGKLAILNFAVAAVAVIAVVGAASSYLQNYLTTNVGQWVMHDLRRTLYHHIHRLSLAEHDEKRTGDLISRVTSDIDSIQDFVTSALLGIVANILTLLGIVGVMLYVSWRFTLISLAIAPVLFVIVYFFTRRIKKASRDVRKTESELISTVEEVFSSIRVVKAFAREDYEERRFERQSLDNVETALQARSMKMKLSPVVDIIVATGTCLMLGYGARLVMADELTRGRSGRLSGLPAQDVQAHARPVEDDGHGLEGGRGIRADPRDPGDRERRARPAARAPGQGLQGQDRIRAGVVRVYAGSARPQGRQLQDRARTGRGIRRPDGRRQDDDRQPGCALLRPDLRDGQNRRHGHPQLHHQVAARADQFRAAGHAPVPRAGLAEHRLRPSGSQARGDRARRRAGQRRRVHRGDAGRLRHDGRRARRDAFRRPAPAHRHRAGRDPQHADPDPGRAHVRTGRAVRAGGHRSPRASDEGQDVDRHRAPPGDDPPRRHDLRHERPSTRGAWHPRRTAGRGRLLFGALRDPA